MSFTSWKFEYRQRNVKAQFTNEFESYDVI